MGFPQHGRGKLASDLCFQVEGQKQAQILVSETEKANAMLVKARPKVETIQLLVAALTDLWCWHWGR
uniref:Uncharacterized protein n=1 Tax=Serinus canaria TaxID=9135 RepID=A0A8C9U6B9_SERCA